MATIPVQDDGTGITGIVVGRAKALRPPSVYFETLYSGIEAWYNQLTLQAMRERKGTPEQNLQEVAESFQPMSYETTQRRLIRVVAEDGKLKCWMVLSLYRMQSGRYEVTAYLS